MRTNLNAVKRAVVLGLSVVCTLCYLAFNALVCAAVSIFTTHLLHLRVGMFSMAEVSYDYTPEGRTPKKSMDHGAMKNTALCGGIFIAENPTIFCADCAARRRSHCCPVLWRILPFRQALFPRSPFPFALPEQARRSLWVPACRRRVR